MMREGVLLIACDSELTYVTVSVGKENGGRGARGERAGS